MPSGDSTPARAVTRLIAVVALISLTACGGGSDAGESSTAATTTTTSSTTTTTTPTTTTSSTTTTTTLPPLGVPMPPPPANAIEPEVKIGRIEIPKLGVSMDMYSGVTLHTLDKGPGHWPGTALPGEWGNVVVAGHRTSHARPFRYIDLLVPGDEIVFTTLGGRFVYAVTGTEVVTPDAVRITEQEYDHTATLFACHPPGSTRERIVVHAEMVDPAPPEP